MSIEAKILDVKGDATLRGLIDALMSDDDGCVAQATFTLQRDGAGCYPIVVMAIDPLHSPLVVFEAIGRALAHAETVWSPVVEAFLRALPPAENNIPVQ